MVDGRIVLVVRILNVVHGRMVSVVQIFDVVDYLYFNRKYFRPHFNRQFFQMKSVKKVIFLIFKWRCKE